MGTESLARALAPTVPEVQVPQAGVGQHSFQLQEIDWLTNERRCVLASLQCMSGKYIPGVIHAVQLTDEREVNHLGIYCAGRGHIALVILGPLID